MAALNDMLSRPDSLNDPKVLDEVHKQLAQARLIAYGDSDSAPDPDQMSALSKEVYNCNLLVSLVEHIGQLNFDGRRDMTSLFTFLLQRQIGNHSPTTEYLLRRPFIFDQLIYAAGQTELHRNACVILRECAKQEQLVQVILGSDSVWEFFQYSLEEDFQIGSDCFTTLSDILKSDPKITAQFLHRNGARFSAEINLLIQKANYVTKRQAIRLQASLINHRKNKDYITLYVSSLDNLKLVMRLMRDRSSTIHFEAFHIFKVFVANPQKPQPIYETMIRNKLKLIEALERLRDLDNKAQDDMFKQELAYVLQRLSELPNKVN